MYTPAQLKKGYTITHEGEPYVVIEAAHHKMGRGGAVVRSKLKNIKTGNVREVTYQGSERIEEADLNRKLVQFLYRDEGGAHFMDEQFEQITIPEEVLGGSAMYVKEGERIDLLLWEEAPVAALLPPKVVLKVTDAPPAVKGDTANNPSKIVTLETGLEILAPMFIKAGDMVRINTDTGEYVERA